MSLCRALALAALVLSIPASAQNAGFEAPGRVEGAGPTLAIGVAAAGTVREILVQEGSRVSAGQVLVKLDCQPLEAELRVQDARARATQANFDRVKNGPRPDEIAVGEAIVGFSQARADEAQKALDRAEALQEGVTVSTAHVLEVRRDARIAAAQLAEARARLSLLRAGSREEDIRQAQALRDAAAAELDATRARLDQCSVRAPADAIVLDVLANRGQYFSAAVPQPLLHLAQDGRLRVRAEVALRDAARVCVTQKATVATEALPNPSIHAEVVSISPAVTTPSTAPPASDVHVQDIVAVVLELDRSVPALPIGSPVTVRFDVCPPKT